VNDAAVELVLAELEVANVWLEMAASAHANAGMVAKARAALFTVDLILGQLALKQSLRAAVSDARDHLWARLRLLETGAKTRRAAA
jgi:hypothetical protein